MGGGPLLWPCLFVCLMGKAVVHSSRPGRSVQMGVPAKRSL